MPNPRNIGTNLCIYGNYGDDFEYIIEDGKLKGKYIREEIEKKIKG